MRNYVSKTHIKLKSHKAFERPILTDLQSFSRAYNTNIALGQDKQTSRHSVGRACSTFGPFPFHTIGKSVLWFVLTCFKLAKEINKCLVNAQAL